MAARIGSTAEVKDIRAKFGTRKKPKVCGGEVLWASVIAAARLLVRSGPGPGVSFTVEVCRLGICVTAFRRADNRIRLDGDSPLR